MNAVRIAPWWRVKVIVGPLTAPCDQLIQGPRWTLLVLTAAVDIKAVFHTRKADVIFQTVRRDQLHQAAGGENVEGNIET
jgi:hypothetical protein